MIIAEVAFKDMAGLKTTTSLKNIPAASAPDLAKLLTLVTAFKTEINAGIETYTLNTWTETPHTPALDTAVGVNSAKGLMTVRYAVGTSLVTSLLYIPNPNSAGFELVEGEGLRMTTAYLDLLTASLTDLAGFDVTAVEGKFVIKNYTGDASRPQANCIRVIDESGKVGYMGVPRALVPSAVALDTFATALETDLITQSKIDGSFYMASLSASPNPAAGIGLPAADATNVLFSPVETGAVLKFGYLGGPFKMQETVKLPSPKSANVFVAGGRYKFDRTHGATVATALTTFYGAPNKTVKFKGSKIIGVNFDSQ